MSFSLGQTDETVRNIRVSVERGSTGGNCLRILGLLSGVLVYHHTPWLALVYTYLFILFICLFPPFGFLITCIYCY